MSLVGLIRQQQGVGNAAERDVIRMLAKLTSIGNLTRCFQPSDVHLLGGERPLHVATWACIIDILWVTLASFVTLCHGR